MWNSVGFLLVHSVWGQCDRRSLEPWLPSLWHLSQLQATHTNDCVCTRLPVHTSMHTQRHTYAHLEGLLSWINNEDLERMWSTQREDDKRSPWRISVKRTDKKGSSGTNDDNNTFRILPEAVLQHRILTEQRKCLQITLRGGLAQM